MWRLSINSFLIPVVAAVALILAPSMVPAADIVDGGGFFSAETLAKANQTIRDLEQKTKHEVRIETFASVSADKVEAVKKMDKAERETFFTKWLHDRAEATKAHGVFVLICKEPAHLRLWGAKEIQKAGFGAEQAKPVRELFLMGFKAKEYDKTLTDALAQLSTTLDGLKSVPKKGAESAGHATPNHDHAARPNQPVQHAPHAPINRGPQPAAPAKEANWSNILVVIAMILGGIFLFSAVMRMFSGGRNYGQSGPGGYGGGYGGGGGGGGGFMSGLTGGIFGALAGSWLYNQFSDHHASAGETHSAGNDSSNVTDSSSSYNDDILESDSGDAGGTDFGGGDFGGDDFGGGGDGGGDF